MCFSYFAGPLIVALSYFGTAAAQENATPVAPAAQGQQKPAPSETPEQRKGVEDYLRSESGKAGKQEPSASASETPQNDAVLVNGALNVPGAPKDSQTVPSLFSPRNAALDKFPILGQPLHWTDAQRRRFLDLVRASGAPIAKLDAKITEELASTVELFELPAAVKSEISGMNDLKFVRLEDSVLLVYAPISIVVGVVKN